MTNIRRWYVFLVSAIGLQVVAWAAIALLRNLLVPGLSPVRQGVSFAAEIVAFQIAVIVIGLPIYLAHWLWAGRLAERNKEERSAFLRRLYLYGMMAGFLGPILANTYALLNAGLRWLLKLAPDQSAFPRLGPGSAVIYHGIPFIILGILWFYHWRIAATDAQHVLDSEGAMTVRRLYLYGFSGTGLALATIGSVALVRWLLFQIGGEATVTGFPVTHLPAELARLLTGITVWLTFWQRAETQFRQDPQEQASVIRKFYLYLAVFVGVLLVVGSATGILAGLLRRLLALPPSGDFRSPLAIMVGTAVLWVYHAAVLRRDAAAAVTQPRQAAVRRIYLYLVAGVGLAAFLFGLGGDISLLIRALAGEPFITDLREQLAGFTAALFAGLPVWLIPWRQAQQAAETDDAAGKQERLSLTRKIYLYFYLFVATMTVLTSAVFIVFQLLSLALGARTAVNLFIELGHAVAFTLIATAIWLYHGSMLRRDGRLETAAAARELAAWRVAVVDGDDGRLGRALLDRLRQELPQLTWQPVGLSAAAVAAMEAETASNPAALLADVDVIVGPWTVTWAQAEGGLEQAAAVSRSPARKLLLPVRPDGWDWAGVEPWSHEALLDQAAFALQQIVHGETVEPRRRLNLAGIVIAAIVGFILVMIIITALANLFFSGLSF